MELVRGNVVVCVCVFVCDLMSVQIAAAQHCTCLLKNLVNLIHQHGVEWCEVAACTQQEQGHQLG